MGSVPEISDLMMSLYYTTGGVLLEQLKVGSKSLNGIERRKRGNSKEVEGDGEVVVDVEIVDETIEIKDEGGLGLEAHLLVEKLGVIRGEMFLNTGAVETS